MLIKQTTNITAQQLQAGHQTDWGPETNLQFHQFIWTSYFHDNLLAVIWPWTDRFVCLPASNQLRACVCGCVYAWGQACPRTVTDCASGRGCFSGSEAVWAAWLWPWPLFKLQSTHITTAVCVVVRVCLCVNTCLSSHNRQLSVLCVCVLYSSWPWGAFLRQRGLSLCYLDDIRLTANGLNWRWHINTHYIKLWYYWHGK